MKDLCDCDVTLASPEALTEWNGVIRGFLAHGSQTPVHLNRLIELEPHSAMAQATRGFALLMLARGELVPIAREAHEAAQAAAVKVGVSSRERGWVLALGHWLEGKPSVAIAVLETVLTAAPHDTLTMKLIHGIRFMLGDSAGMRTSVEAVLHAHGSDHPLRGFALGCHAFALEETGAYAEAEAAGLEGLTFASDDAWGLHAVAHVYDMTARSEKGIRLIAENDGSWLHCNNFRYHVWWHKALLHLDLGDTETALSLYDQKVREDRTDDYRDIANATSLLMRLELEGVDVGARWDEIADYSAQRTEDGCLVFADLHYMLALIGTDREEPQAAMIARMAAAPAKSPIEMDRITADPGLAAAQGLAAFGEGLYEVAFSKLSAARKTLRSIGGSHAQRDVFERMTVDAGLRAGQRDAVRAILDERTAQRHGNRDRFAQTRYATLDAAAQNQSIAAQ